MAMWARVMVAPMRLLDTRDAFCLMLAWAAAFCQGGYTKNTKQKLDKRPKSSQPLHAPSSTFTASETLSSVRCGRKKH
jgi:hypothetical protein